MLFSRKDLTKLLIPLVVEQLLAVAVGMVDVMMVAAVGENAVSGVSLVDSISMLLIQLLSALATGGAVVASQYVGKRDLDRACHAAGQLISVTMLFSIVIAGGALTFRETLLRTIFGHVDEAVMQNAMIYFKITALSYPFLALYNSCAALYRSMGNSKVSMQVSMIMNGVNVLGNMICIYGLHMGVEGVAYPTLFSRMLAAGLMLYLICRPMNPIRVRSVQDLKPERGMIGNILNVGVPSGLENSIFQVGKLTLQSLVSSLGTTALASYAVACNLVTLQYLPGNAIGLAMITVVGQCIGAGALDQVKIYTKKLILLNYGFLLVICSIMFLGSEGIVGLYNLSPEAAFEAGRMIRAHAVAMIVWPLAFTLPNMLRASMDARFTMLISVFSMWVFRIVLAYCFVRGMNLGIMGVWYGMFSDWVFRAIAFVLRFRGFENRKMRTVE